jgi:nucleoside-diphosphate-sugar epimerase
VSGLVEAGYEVRAFTRRNALPNERSATVKCVRIQGLDDTAALRDGLCGVKVVVHTAARVHKPPAPGDERLFRAVNVEGTRNLFTTAIEQKVEQLVFLSTISVFGAATQVNDATVPAPLTAYARSKLEAESVVQQLARESNCHATILRPTGVYGSDMPGNILHLYKLVARGLPIPVPRETVRRSLLYVGNMVAAILHFVRRPADDCFVVADRESFSIQELVQGIAHSVQRPPRLIRLPGPWLRRLGEIGEQLHGVVRLPINRHATELFTHTLVVDSSRLWETAGAPPFSTPAGLDLTGKWFLASRSRV